MTTIEQQLQQIRQRMNAACALVRRAPDTVSLLAVSKTFGPDAVAQAADAGQRQFGENYIQEGVDKKQALASHPAHAELVWHCIGPVQSNKTKLVAEHFDWVQSVDRLKIAQRLNDQRPPHLPALQVCLQVNIDGGANKSGVAPTELPALVRAVSQLPRLNLRGLMFIPEPTSDSEAQKSIFMSAKATFDYINSQGWGLDTLSMGMSDDLENAIAAGSTLVRVGRAVFGQRPAKV